MPELTVELAWNVLVELLSAGLLMVLGVIYANSVFSKKRQIRTEFLNRVIGVGQLACNISENTLPGRSKDIGNQEDAEILRAYFVFSHEVDVFKKYRLSIKGFLSHKQNEKAETFERKLDRFENELSSMNRDKGFWMAYGELIETISKISHALRRRSHNRKTEIRRLHESFKTGQQAAQQIADKFPKTSLSSNTIK